MRVQKWPILPRNNTIYLITDYKFMMPSIYNKSRIIQLTWSTKAKSDPKLFTAPPPFTVVLPTPLQMAPVPDRLQVPGTELPLGMSDLYV